MSGYHFFAMLARMKYISRWGLMRSTFHENISEHSLDVAIIAHALATIRNRRFDGNLNPERAALLGVFHDCTEILTGDLPTPVKYFNPEIRDAYKKVEHVAGEKLLSLLPEDLRESYTGLFLPEPEDEPLWKIVKAADKIAALIKCVEEEKAGNPEFSKASVTLRQSIDDMRMPEAECFLRDFLPSYTLTLDELD